MNNFEKSESSLNGGGTTFTASVGDDMLIQVKFFTKVNFFALKFFSLTLTMSQNRLMKCV